MCISEIYNYTYKSIFFMELQLVLDFIINWQLT